MSQENHFPSTFQSDRSWSVLNNNDDDDNKYRFYPSFNSEKSWSVLGSQDVDDRPFGISTYGYAAEDENSKVREYLRDQQQHRFTQLPPVVERISSPPISSFPEPEFAPSLNASTKEFLENTFKYDRKSDEDFVGRPNECESDDDCSPPPPLSPPPSQFLSSNFINDGLDSDQMTTIQSDQIHHDVYQSSQVTITESSSRDNWTLVWALSLIICIIAVIYGISDYIPDMILGCCFS